MWLPTYLRLKILFHNYPKYIITFGFICYIGLFIFIYNPVGTASIALSFIPLLIVGYYYGLRGALVGGLVTFVANFALLMVLSNSTPLAVGEWTGMATNALIGLVVGYLIDTDKQLKQHIAERQTIETDLRAALKQEQSLQNFRGQFTSMISHDFRNPLSVISLSADMLLRYRDRLTPERQRERLWQIQAQVERLENLLDDLLIIGKAQSAQKQVNRSPVELVVYCRDIVDEMREMDGGKHDIAFWSDEAQVMAQVDVRLMQRVFYNLLTNALKYSPAGKSVEIHLTRQAQFVQIKVRDKGIGIAAEDMPNLFQMFSRASNVGDIPGNGLGLVIVKEIMEMHSGQVQVDSVLNEGTVFTLTLPLIDEADETVEATPVRAISPSETDSEIRA